MASMAATTMGLSTQFSSTRLLVFQPMLFHQRRRTSSSSSSSSMAKKQRNISLCMSAARDPHSLRNAAAAAPVLRFADDNNNNNTDMLLSGTTRTVTTLFGMAVLCVKAFAKILPPPSLLASTGSTLGPLFFAYFSGNRTRGALNTPLTVVAAGLKKWLDIYSGVLLIRVLLSWFPNIPWERQPLSAIRDLCDPYLSLFRNIIPPVFDTLDISPLLAFAVLGALANVLSVSV